MQVSQSVRLLFPKASQLERQEDDVAEDEAEDGRDAEEPWMDVYIL